MTFSQMGAVGAIFGLLSVALGAFGAHALKGVLSEYGESVWAKAFLYQVIHAVMLTIIPLMFSVTHAPELKYAGYFFIAGILFFSGSLYFLAWTGIKRLGAITPFGGISFLIGWGYVIYAYLNTTIA